MFLKVGSIRQSKLLFLGCAIISDLYLFQEVVLLNHCLIFSKNLILSLIEKVTTGTYSLELVCPKFVPAMLLFCSINTQSFVHDKLNGRYLNGIVTLMFRVGTGGRFASPSFPALFGVCTTIFVLYKHYHQHHQFHLYNNSINFLML